MNCPIGTILVTHINPYTQVITQSCKTVTEIHSQSVGLGMLIAGLIMLAVVSSVLPIWKK